MSRILRFLFISLLFYSCSTDVKKELIDVTNIKVNFDVDRFEQKFYTSNASNIDDLKKEYPYLLSSAQDSVWVNRIDNEDEQYLFKESQKVFGDFSDSKKQLKNLFKHIKYYNPKFEAPKVITHISDLDYEYPVIYADSLLFVALDMYLGKDNVVYKDFPSYISQGFDKDNLSVDVAKDIINRSFPKPKGRKFLDKIINEGKSLYLLDSYLPLISDEQKINYSIDKMEWAKMNELNIWKYFIENELLFSNDSKLDGRFIDVAPFSKFYKQFDQESPGRIGVWIGWQIVRSYMKNNDVTLQELLRTSPDIIYKKSKYKPKKN